MAWNTVPGEPAPYTSANHGRKEAEARKLQQELDAAAAMSQIDSSDQKMDQSTLDVRLCSYYLYSCLESDNDIKGLKLTKK